MSGNPSGNSFLIFSVVLALAIIGGAVFYTATQDGGPSSSTPKLVTVPAAMTACGTGESCIMVDKSCGLCCDYAAINARQETQFNKILNQTCASYRGPLCKCSTLKNHPSCVGNKCALVKWPSSK